MIEARDMTRETVSSRDDKGRPDKDYPHYAPAYRFGYWLGSQDPYRKKTWSEIEKEAEEEWQASHARPWEEYAAVVQHAWNDVRNDLLTVLRDTTAEGNPRGSFEDRFHRHFADTYQAEDISYRQIAPAYHLGYDMAVDERVRNQDWNQIETEAERRWTQYGVNFFWKTAQSAIAFAWREARAEPLGWPRHASEYEGFATLFHEHFRANYSGKQANYAVYAPAYYLGFDLAVQIENREQSWDEIQATAQKVWRNRGESAWEEVEAAAYFAWNTMQEQLQPSQTMPAEEGKPVSEPAK